MTGPSRRTRVGALAALAKALLHSGRGGRAGVVALLRVVPRMLRASVSGTYPNLDHRRMALAALGLLYVLSPIDLVPEALLGLLGLGDDALVAAFVTGTFLAEAQAFLDWERSPDDPTAHEPPTRGGRVVLGQVVDS
jgi:uncharacterized membrane protein YkvA (DUF1232 family)